MFTGCLHSVGGDDPYSLININLGPSGPPDFSRSCRRNDRKLKGAGTHTGLLSQISHE